MTEKVTASIVGGSGYVGGELLRLMLDHPHIRVHQVTSERQRGSFVHFTHPNLRGRTKLKFSGLEDLETVDLLCLCLPHGQAMRRIETLAQKADYLLDCSADFRLSNPEVYAEWYGHEHLAPDWLDRFVYGLPEVNRDPIRQARFVTGVGCNATAVNLALLPLARTGLLNGNTSVVCEVKVGSSEAGNKANEGSHHPVRSGAMRSFAPVRHRHTAEIQQVLGWQGNETGIHMSATAVDNVRGALATVHAFVSSACTERDIWKAFRQTYGKEPFVRLVKEAKGLYRLPEPKILAGSNYADVGFALDPSTGRLVTLCALDNLMKGAAGTAMQSVNLMLGWDETLGLGFPGLHPI